MQVQPYLNFDGRCEEALEFYRRALGAKIEMLMRFKESPDPSMVSPGSEEKVMHSSFRVGDAIVLASDGQCQGHRSIRHSSRHEDVNDTGQHRTLLWDFRFNKFSNGPGSVCSVASVISKDFMTSKYVSNGFIIVHFSHET